jgi:putative DNA primase/helicase
MMDFNSFCCSIGLLPRAIDPDGRWHRCPTESHPHSKNGAYKLALDGGIGFAMDWSVHPEPLTWRPEGDIHLQPVDRAAIERRKAEERMRTAAATKAAQEYFAACRPLREGHPYLTKKHLDMAGCFGLRVEKAGWLVVPMYVNGQIISVQKISPEGEKLFWLGAPTRGAHYVIERRDAPLSVLCEGLATGLGIFAAVPTARVVVAFNAGNLARVAETLTWRGMVVVAADNDAATEQRTGTNPGIKAAQDAAAILGCGVAIPSGIVGTDWLDYRNEKIEERRQVPRFRRGISDLGIRRAVDAEINAAMLRNATLSRRAA